MSRPNAELIAEVFEDVPVSKELADNETCLISPRQVKYLGGSRGTRGATSFVTSRFVC